MYTVTITTDEKDFLRLDNDFGKHFLKDKHLRQQVFFGNRGLKVEIPIFDIYAFFARLGQN